MTVHETCPDVYVQFLKGDFSFQKANKKFSKMALDQVHEQNNEKIKGVSGATHLLNGADMSGIERWETCFPEIARIIEILEQSIDLNSIHELEKPHHGDRTSFKYTFSSGVKKLVNGFDLNPFEENHPVNISNTSISYGTEIQNSLQPLLKNGEMQFQEFLNERLINRNTSIDAPTRKNNYKLPRNLYDAMKEEMKKLTYPPSFLNEMREVIRVRKSQANELF